MPTNTKKMLKGI